MCAAYYQKRSFEYNHVMYKNIWLSFLFWDISLLSVKGCKISAFGQHKHITFERRATPAVTQSLGFCSLVIYIKQGVIKQEAHADLHRQ